MKLLLASVLALTPVASLADEYQPGFSSSRTCFKTEYKEEYVPGTSRDPGYVKSWNETIEVPCSSRGGYSRRTTIEYDNNDCSDGTLAGGILGGGLATSISRGKDRWWAIPLGIVGGSMVGCSLNGG